VSIWNGCASPYCRARLCVCMYIYKYIRCAWERVGWPEIVSEWRRGGDAGQARVLCDSVSEILSVCWCRLSKNLQLFIVVSAVFAAAVSRSSFLPLLSKLFRCVFVLRELCHCVPTERCARMCPDGIVLSRPLQYHALVARHAVFFPANGCVCCAEHHRRGQRTQGWQEEKSMEHCLG